MNEFKFRGSRTLYNSLFLLGGFCKIFLTISKSVLILSNSARVLPDFADNLCKTNPRFSWGTLIVNKIKTRSSFFSFKLVKMFESTLPNSG